MAGHTNDRSITGISSTVTRPYLALMSISKSGGIYWAKTFLSKKS